MAAATYELNSKEKQVLGTFPSPLKDAELGAPMKIEDIARECFKKKGTSPKSTGNSWVRNSLRKLLRLGLVKPGPGSRTGTYLRTGLSLTEIEKKEAERRKAVETKKQILASRAKSAKKV